MEAIEIRGARQNSLRNVSLDIPKRKLTVFTGVSGSGKSSLVFGTVAAEAQRLINETYTAFVQSFMPSLPRPDVDDLQNLTAAIIIDQERMGANSRSTVGTATDAYSMLRLVFSRLSEPHVGPSYMFSFNEPDGMCPACEGLGRVSRIDEEAIVDRSLSLDDGAITVPNFQVGAWYWTIIARSGYFDPAKKLADYTAEEWQRLMHAPEEKIKNDGFSSTFEGIVPKLTRLYMGKDLDSLQPHVRRAMERIATFAVCDECGGSRLNEAARTATVAGVTIGACSAMQISDLTDWAAGLREPTIAPLLGNLNGVLGSLVEIGLGYLSLDRPSGTLSGGEAQRVKMIRHLGSPLTDVTYVFDEPTVGLHPHDVRRMNELLQRLRDKGNTVLVVEHEPEVIKIADHVVDMGPGAGSAGGTVVFEGTVAQLRSSGTATGAHLDSRPSLERVPREPTGSLRVADADLHNLRNVSVDIPLGVLTAVTGVAGSGKSSLMRGCLPQVPGADVRLVDQSPIRGSRRSNPATYTGVLDGIRTAFAKANKVKPGLFSANSSGACPECKGIGLIYTDLAFMAGVARVCELCEGKRFTDEVLALRLRGRNIYEVLTMPVVEAHEFFTEKAVRAMLAAMVDVGLGYLTLGQPLTTLSGGERQRIRLAIEMAAADKDAGAVLVLDEPTTGLHMQDVDALVDLLHRLVDRGRTVIVIEHDLDVVARADHVIDLGPGAGHDGGLIVFEGTPAELAEAGTLTGTHLAEHARRGEAPGPG